MDIWLFTNSHLCQFIEIVHKIINNYLSVLYKHIIQVEIKNVGLKVGGGGRGHKHTIAPQKKGGHMPPLPPSPASYASECVLNIYYQNRTLLMNQDESVLSYEYVKQNI